MMKLVGTDGKRFYSWDLNPGTYVVGRSKDCDFHITNGTVSRNHARIIVGDEDGSCQITDLGSHNGTTINGNRIKETKISAGDAVLFGSTEFRIATEDDIASQPSTNTQVVLSEPDMQNSVYMSINEVLQPLKPEVTQKSDLLPVLFDMAKMLVLPEPKEVMLEKSLKLISRVIKAERMAVLFVSDDQKEVYPAASLESGLGESGAFNLSKTIIKEIITNKNAILICDPTEDPRFAEQKSIIMSSMKSALAVPMFDEGRVHGILYADTSNPIDQYTDEHLRILATFGNLIASRLLNYELLNERQQNQIMEVELNRASSIQKKLLVPNPPTIDGYKVHTFQEQSRSVGGDLYDVTCLPDGRLLFMVADVSGKGMGAALLMSNILASFRILYDNADFNLNRSVELVSEQLLRFSEQADFATLFIGLLEPGSNKLRYINAGHNPPLLVRADKQCEYLQASGIMIGAFPGMTWEDSMVEMNPDDILFLFSDGVPEAERDGEMYGEERTEKKVVEVHDKNPDEIADHIMKDLNGFMGDAPRSDDITLLVLKKVGE